MLCFTCLLLLVIRLIYPLFIEPDETIVVKNLPLLELKSANHEFENQSEGHITSTAALFAFNPNTVTKEQLLELGFQKKTAETFIKFRSRGFTFKKKEDLKKVYGVSDEFYKKLEPYIITTPEVATENTRSALKKNEIRVDLNLADSSSLIALKGIGPSFAKRILKYRTLLGGFTSAEQLKEVYGFTEEMYTAIESSVELESLSIKKININTDDFKTINRHPYIGYELTKLIFNSRKKQALTEKDLKDILQDESLFAKLLPYINFN